MQVLRESRAQQPGNGGDARARQLSWLLAEAGIHEYRFGESYEHAALSNLFAAARFVYYEKVSLPLRLKFLKRVGYRYREQKNRSLELSEPAVLLWEYTASPLASDLARRFRLPVVALPHNIEALVKDERLLYTRSTDLVKRLRKELNLIRRCHRVYVISRHDQWFYQQFGVSPEYLPYFPDPDRYGELSVVRQERRSSAGGAFVLVLGSAQYPPIRKGMEHLLRALVRSNMATRMSIRVAGFGTEALRQEFQDTGLHIEGTVSVERLRELQKGARVLLSSSQEGSGALTKIPEALIAGIPVVANPMAARSAEHLEGVYVYDSFEELGHLLQQDFKMPPMPERPYTYEKRFVDDLLHLAGAA